MQEAMSKRKTLKIDVETVMTAKTSNISASDLTLSSLTVKAK